MQPAVANLIAETVEDFWSSDLMGAWGMGGQSDPDASDQEPASAPGGSVGALADDFIVGLDVHSSGGESTGRETDGNKGPGPSLSHRRVVSEDFLREQGESKPGGDQLLPSAGKQSPKEGLAQSEKTLGVTVAASGAGKVTQSPDVAPELETLVKGQSEGVSEPEAPPSSNLLAGLVDQASAASGTPGEKSIGDAQHKSATSSRIGVSSSGSPRGNMESGPSSKATSSEAVSEMRPRLGPPLLDDVFEDGPEVTRLRSEIHQRDEEIRWASSAVRASKFRSFQNKCSSYSLACRRCSMSQEFVPTLYSWVSTGSRCCLSVAQVSHSFLTRYFQLASQGSHP